MKEGIQVSTNVDETVETETAVESSRYAEPEIAKSITERLASARKQGYTRPMFISLTGLTYSAMWRAEHERVHTEEAEKLAAVLNRIEKGDFKIVKHGRRAAQAVEIHPLTSGVKGASKTGTVHLTTTKKVDGQEVVVARCATSPKHTVTLEPVADATELSCGNCKRLAEANVSLELAA